MNLKILAGLTLAMLATTPAVEADFDVTAIGVRGGLDDGNLSAWMIAPQEQARAVMCDAGTLVNGMETARHLGTLQGSLDTILHNDIAGYLISHAHLDHVAGMLIASPEDSAKPIYALPSVSKALLDSYFNGQAWANFTDRGKAPLGKYKLVDLTPGKATPLVGTAIFAHDGSHHRTALGGDRRQGRDDPLLRAFRSYRIARQDWVTTAPMVPTMPPVLPSYAGPATSALAWKRLGHCST